LTDAGAELLRRLQELYDSGLTMTEASEILRANIYKKDTIEKPVSQRITRNDMKPDQTNSLISALREELAFLRQRVTNLDQQLRSEPEAGREPPPWWTFLREEIDAP